MILNSFILLAIIIKISISCPKGFFKLDKMKNCFTYLNCSHLSEIKVGNIIGYGAVKEVRYAEWKKFKIAHILLKNELYKKDFKEGLKMLKLLNPSQFVTQLVGFCEKQNIILTEYHHFNNANNIHYLNRINNLNTSKLGRDLCINYAQIITFLHNSPAGVRVNCDSNQLEKLLGQFLIKSDFSIVLNDLDAIPEVINSTVKCGLMIQDSNFLPPEQRLFHKNKNFSPYNEKIDIWKIPDVCNFFLKIFNIDFVQYAVFNIHKRCKHLDPSKRPTALEVLQEYLLVL